MELVAFVLVLGFGGDQAQELGAFGIDIQSSKTAVVILRVAVVAVAVAAIVIAFMLMLIAAVRIGILAVFVSFRFVSNTIRSTSVPAATCTHQLLHYT